jgi:hypothetical protein
MQSCSSRLVRQNARTVLIDHRRIDEGIQDTRRPITEYAVSQYGATDGYDDDDDDHHHHNDHNKPVWPSWAVGAPFRGARRIHINHICIHINANRL